ncbi:hypothetical protein FN846DRAFT_362438 [Sphaerosporella brunnea]|uniref:Uncharacterized protein n=1 Tax=Sphaerosporella brunnea TaxID=1250544 RepID=A0A5J5EIL2_9PEZI|nr:hypothetical protein FN846DRAFT_362438 [Sphaerosporella brunnea]
MDKPIEESDKKDWIAPAAIAGAAAAIAGAAAVAVHKSSDSEDTPSPAPKTAELVDETATHKKPDGSKVTEAVDESTAHKAVGEELITEPAPQPASSIGEIVAEVEAPKVLAESQASEGAAPTVVVSPPVAEEDSKQQGRTVEIVQPSPAGEIFANSVWNQSVSPFLQYSLENSPEGIRKRQNAQLGTPPQDQPRPTSSGSDIVSARTHRNIMHNFWQLFFFGWLGGVGRFFSGVFSKKKKDRAAARAGASS